MGDSLLHVILRHLQRQDFDLVRVRIHVCLQGDVVSFMTFYRVRVAYSPTLAVLIVHEYLAVIANCFCRSADRCGLKRHRPEREVISMRGLLLERFGLSKR
jgi:hypothetical protein